MLTNLLHEKRFQEKWLCAHESMPYNIIVPLVQHPIYMQIGCDELSSKVTNNCYSAYFLTPINNLNIQKQTCFATTAFCIPDVMYMNSRNLEKTNDKIIHLYLSVNYMQFYS